MSTTTHTNRLANETSPYLLQHAHNPVDWYPWGEEALNKARQEDKPILLSIGYSACHWCHVMAHESFEHEFTAEVMNEAFVNIKVDREERPDLDKIYQLAHQVLMRRGGGWPLTVILTPDEHVPFFAGTYFPPEPRHNMPSFVTVLERVADYYRDKRDEIQKQNASFQAFLQQTETADQPSREPLRSSLLDQSRQQLEKSYDGLYGGFGQAPKFPHPTNLERLLRHWAATRGGDHVDTTALDMALTTLKAMAFGGIYDQLGGGFCRYSVDQEWMIPHFEKMLYDNGPLLCLYVDAWQASAEYVYQKVALETAEWVMREMQSPDGGYYSTLDADSEGKEGQFYVWNPPQVKAILEAEQYAIFAARFGLDRAANFEGHWHLHVYETEQDLANRFQLSIAQVRESLNESRQILFREREQRIHPGRDEKILTAWNGLMIKAMATTGRRLCRTEFIDSAQSSAEFIRDNVCLNGRLFAVHKEGKTRFSAYLDDYAFLLDGLLELLQARWSSNLLHFAMQLADTLLERFQDNDRGGFYFTADDHEQLIQRPKPFADEAIPAGNGIAAHALLRLGYLLGETRYVDAAERTLRAAWQQMSEVPYAHNALLLALEEFLRPPQVIVIRGQAPQIIDWQQQCQQSYAPRRMVFAIPDDETALPAGLASRKPRQTSVAYICTGYECGAPLTDGESLASTVNKI